MQEVDTYQSAAQAGYGVLYHQYTEGYDARSGKYSGKTLAGNFWFGGNTLHTCLDYLIAADIPKEKKMPLASTLLETGRGIYRSLRSETDWWKDDYAWWGNAFGAAIQNRENLGLKDAGWDNLFKTHLDDMRECWGKLNCNWRSTAYNSNVPGGRSDNAASEVEIPIYGGVFNTEPDGTDGSMSGRNSVTNEGFWILSRHVEQYFPTDTKVLERKGQPQEWFDRWLADGTLLNEQGLVLERPTGNAASEAWYWLGDQGLFIEALSTADAEAYAPVITKIAASVTSSPILHENMQFVSDGLDTYIADYATGKGILMRGLAALNLKTTGKPFSGFLKKNAAAVWSSRDAVSNHFMFNWEKSPPGQGIKLEPLQEPQLLRVDDKDRKPDSLCDLIMQTAGQDALNAALSVAAPGEKIGP